MLDDESNGEVRAVTYAPFQLRIGLAVIRIAVEMLMDFILKINAKNGYHRDASQMQQIIRKCKYFVNLMWSSLANK